MMDLCTFLSCPEYKEESEPVEDSKRDRRLLGDKKECTRTVI